MSAILSMLRVWLYTYPTRSAFIIAAFWQLVLVLTVILSTYYLRPSLSWAECYKLLTAWDAGHYLNIAFNGYQTHGESARLIVFFPFYPFLIHILSDLLGYIGAALFITSSSSIIAHALFIILLRDFALACSVQTRAILLFFFSPILIYFTNIYTEALYIAEIIAFMLLIKRNNFKSAALIGGLASLTRLMGVLCLIPYLAQCFTWRPLRVQWQRLFWSAPIFCGYLTYLGINYQLWHTPFYFTFPMKTYWHKTMVNPLDQLWAELSALLCWIDRIFPRSPFYPADQVATLLVPVILVWGYFVTRKTVRLPRSWYVWSFAQWLIVASQSYWVSNLRYLAAIVPLYIIIAQILAHSYIMYAFVLSLFVLIAAKGIMQYASGGWIF